MGDPRCDQRGNHLTIYECSRDGSPTSGRSGAANQLLNYTGANPSNRIDDLLAEISTDPTGIFRG